MKQKLYHLFILPALIIGIVACGSDSPSAYPADDDAVVILDNQRTDIVEPSQGAPADDAYPAAAAAGDNLPSGLYQIIVPANDIEVGQPRVPFVVRDGDLRVSDVRAISVTAFDLSQDPPVPLWNGVATNYSDYIVPYWVIRPNLPTAGIWGFVTRITGPDGTQSEAQFAIEVLDDPQAPTIGETVPASNNRTVSSQPDVTMLSSAQNPDPALHQLTVAEIVENNRPAVISFNTPAFCQTAICSPVLTTIEAGHAEFKDEVDFLHLEIYKEFDPLVVADEVGEWNLASEPWTFVLDRNGVVAARIAGPVSPIELSDILAELLR